MQEVGNNHYHHYMQEAGNNHYHHYMQEAGNNHYHHYMQEGTKFTADFAYVLKKVLYATAVGPFPAFV
jgi:hypothetical protein